MSALRGLITGFGMAAIKDKEAKDNLRMKIAESAGIDYYTKDKPEHEKRERMIKTEFDQVVSLLDGSEAGANWFAENGWITGDGNAVNNIINFAKQKKLNLNSLKNFDWEGTTYEERKIARNQTLEEKRKKIEELTGGNFGGIGLNTAKNQLEGFGAIETEDTAGTIQTTDTTAIDTTQEVSKEPTIGERQVLTTSTPITEMFSSVGTDVEGAQARYKHIANTVNELEGYTTNVIYGEGGQINLNMFGERRNEAAAHIALANRLITQNPQQYNQNNAATTAKQQLNYLTVSLFENIAAELKVEYKSGSGKLPAIFGTPGTTYDANKVLSNGQTIDQIILGTINEIPTGPSGEINEAVLARLIENIPDGLIINGANYKQQLKTELAIRSSNFWAKRNI
jgi:hypothetical protein